MSSTQNKKRVTFENDDSRKYKKHQSPVPIDNDNILEIDYIDNSENESPLRLECSIPIEYGQNNEDNVVESVLQQRKLYEIAEQNNRELLKGKQDEIESLDRKITLLRQDLDLAKNTARRLAEKLDSVTRKEKKERESFQRCDEKKNKTIEGLKKENENLREELKREKFTIRVEETGVMERFVAEIKIEGQTFFGMHRTLLLGDGLIYQVLRSAYKNDPQTLKKVHNSPFYGGKLSLFQLREAIRTIGKLPDRVILSVGSLETSTQTSNFEKVVFLLGALFEALYQRGVRELFVMPGVTYPEMPSSRKALNRCLKYDAGKRHEWQYTYLEEIEEMMARDERRDWNAGVVYAFNAVVTEVGRAFQRICVPEYRVEESTSKW